MKHFSLALALLMLGGTMLNPIQTSATTRASSSVSKGFTNRGSVERSVRLRSGNVLRYAGEYTGHGHFWGTQELVSWITQAAQKVHQRPGRAKLTVGEVSRPSGGRIGGHRSHQSGRDIDIGFYYLDTSNRTVYLDHFEDVDRQGVTASGYKFDDARNYALIAGLLEGPSPVQHIFVATYVKERLIRTARSRRQWLIAERMEKVLMQPRHGHPHRNHYHLRIYCSNDDRPACRDRAPFWPWVPFTNMGAGNVASGTSGGASESHPEDP